MEGGAMRGLFTAGVTDVFMENNIDFDGAIGVSAGAAFGCNIKSRQPGRVIRYNVRFAKEWRFASWRSFFLTGDIYGGKFDYELLPKYLDVWDTETFAENPMEFWCVATDMNTGRALYHKCSDGGEADLKWIQGGASMPVVSKPVLVDGYTISDGGAADSVPYRFFEKQGYDRNVIILTQPAFYRKEQFSAAMLLLLKTALRRYPALYRTLKERWHAYNAEISDIVEAEKAGKVLVIRPEGPLDIGSLEHDPEEKRRVYQLGRRAAMNRLNAVRAYLSE